jgi:hypothetical protein
MTTDLNAVTTSYKTQCDALLLTFELIASITLVQGFWSRWTRMHLGVLKSFAKENPQNKDTGWDKLNEDLMKSRLRLSSALYQGLKNNSHQDQIGSELRALLAAHDHSFLQTLEGHREKLKRELAEAKTVHRALGAYAQSARQLGDSKLW